MVAWVDVFRRFWNIFVVFHVKVIPDQEVDAIRPGNLDIISTSSIWQCSYVSYRGYLEELQFFDVNVERFQGTTRMEKDASLSMISVTTKRTHASPRADWRLNLREI